MTSRNRRSANVTYIHNGSRTPFHTDTSCGYTPDFARQLRGTQGIYATFRTGMGGLSLIPQEHVDRGYLGQLDDKLVFRGPLIQGQGLVFLAGHVLGSACQTRREKSSFWCGLPLCHIALQRTQAHWKQAGHRPFGLVWSSSICTSTEHCGFGQYCLGSESSSFL